jgi:hypothetical protein
MNYQIAIAGFITLIAFFAHTFVGIRQALTTAPARLTEKGNVVNFEVVERNWVQSICAFQMVTIDLLALSVLLFLLAFTDILGSKELLALGLAAFYLLWGIIWLLQLLFLKRRAKDFLLLSQWLFWFVCAGLMYWGAQSL